ncbi:o-succinylbenzoate synthase [Marinilabiliaceae bacterium JC017]|nr:o-succinylbenzoate synthase [Marinilabiliaceae bacterium JC017]
MLKADFKKHTFRFIRPGGTSRGILTQKESWYIRIWDTRQPSVLGIGEASIIKGLSYDDRPDFEEKVANVCENINEFSSDYHHLLRDWPAIRFALEVALLDLQNAGRKELFPSAFVRGEAGIRINGLIWMGTPDFMLEQIEKKLEQGFSCVKLKIGAIDFDKEMELLKYIRKRFSKDTIELRVDANGAFTPADAMRKLDVLSTLAIHSIEQPIRAGQWEEMRHLCQKTPLPIALDEELIGVSDQKEKQKLLETIQPQYIILKPSLVGGCKAAEEWIAIAEQNNTGWWITSALEGNIGLNALAQWTFSLSNFMPQGLGTGQLYHNNINSPLEIRGEHLYHNAVGSWQDPFETDLG